MRIVIFGLTISSSWGNGHATIWRGLLAALAARGHDISFYEKDVPWYAENRDMTDPPGVALRLYKSWGEALETALPELRRADVCMVTSYCPDGLAASDLVVRSGGGLRVFYDLDTPVTLEALSRGERVPYMSPGGLGEFDLVLSYTGGSALRELRGRLGAKRAAALYGSVDPSVHRPRAVPDICRADMSYLGTYAADRQQALEDLFIGAARRLPSMTFLIGGPLYPKDFPWLENISYIQHIDPPRHSVFYCSSRLTLNVTRGAMAKMGYCPSGRLFEAAACGTPVLSDNWEGLERFFEPGREIIIASETGDAVRALGRDPEELQAIGLEARRRALKDHTAARRAEEFERIIAGEDIPCGG